MCRCVYFVFFFFSSRRRHTRSTRDWSSDVCSSDLMSFANQALAAEFMVKNHESLEKRVYPVPEEIDREIARLKLASMGMRIDVPTAAQEIYMSSWEEG